MADSPNGIAAVIVLYHPNDDVLRNIEVIATQVERVWAIDNTEKPDSGFAGRIAAPNVEYVALGRNAGIAAALNVGVQRCADAGYESVVTLDQDSTPEGDMVERLVECVKACGTDRVGVIGPVHDIENAPPAERFPGCRPQLMVITSGCLLSVAAWREIGGFDEDLFIDQVDHDFCLRLGLAERFVGVCGSAALAHRMGDMVERRLLGPVYVSNHSPVRRYYITRNRLEMIRRYGKRFPEFAAAEQSAQRHELLKMVLFESERVRKLRMAWRGWRDARKGRLGPYVP